MRRVAIGLIAAMMAAGFAASASASPGTYSVVACDAAGGPNRSWTAQPGPGGIFLSRQRCPALGEYDGFGMRSSTLALKAPQLAGSWWRFEAPAGTSLVSLDWAGHYATSAPGWVARVESSRGVLAGCGPSARACERQWAHGAKPARFDLNGAGWVRVGATCLAATGCRTGDGRTTPYVDASTWYARMTVRDPSPPSVSVTGAATDHRWVSPGSSVDVSAVDPSGVQEIQLLVDGREVQRLPFNCDWTRVRPCLDRTASFTLPLALAEGTHSVVLAATDAAGNRSEKAVDVGVDGSAPVADSAPEVVGGPGWRPSPSFSLRWTLPGDGTGAPAVASLLSVCPVGVTPGGASCLSTRRIPGAPGAESWTLVDLPADGEWSARVAFEDSVGNLEWMSASPAAPLRCDRAVPGPGRIDAPAGWIGRAAARSIAIRVTTDPDIEAPPSGIAGWAISRGSQPGFEVGSQGVAVEIPIADFPEGVTDLAARAISGSGVASRSVAVAKVKIDETPPTLDFTGIPDSLWSRQPVTVVARGRDQANLSGMGVSDGGSAGVRIGVDSGPMDERSGDENSLDITMDGVHAVTAEATDSAGNPSGRRAVTVRIDGTAPERVAFLPQDVSDPRVVRVDAVDSTSGIDGVKIRIRPVSGGDWIELPVRVSGGRFEALIDESRLRDGLWEMEAVATDVAGNARTSDRTIDGDPAVVAIPLRMATRIDGTIGRSTAGPASDPAVVTAPHGEGATIGGTLLDGEDRPVGSAVVSLTVAPVMAGAAWSSAGSIVTDRLGRFSYRLPPGPSRRIHVTFDGDRRALPSSRTFTLRVPALTTLSASPRVVRVGRVAVFSGRLSGGMIPSGGKLVAVQALIPKRGWQTFAVGRSNGWGEWSVRYRFRSSVGRAGYSIRAVVPSEAAYPFDRFTSRPVQVTAIG